MDKDTRKVITAAEQQGFTVRLNSKQHVMVFLNGQFVTTFAGTPGDRRGLLNGIAALRRHGFLWPPPGKGKRT